MQSPILLVRATGLRRAEVNGATDRGQAPFGHAGGRSGGAHPAIRRETKSVIQACVAKNSA